MERSDFVNSALKKAPEDMQFSLARPVRLQ
jgi:hypothetical protein